MLCQRIKNVKQKITPDCTGFFADVGENGFEQLWLRRKCRLECQNTLPLSIHSTKHKTY